MAWTNPTLRTTGELVTAAIWNTDIVDNLNYLKTNASLEGTWTPTLTNITLGNGSVTARYVKVGKLVFFTIVLTWGTTTSASGTFTFTTPFTAAIGGGMPAATGYALDAGSASYPVIGELNDTTHVRALCINASGTYATRDFVNATAPFTWGSTDELRLEGVFEAAA